MVGYPNVGKSAVINALSHRAKTIVSPIAGTTRGYQIVRTGGLHIIDSPGVIPFREGESTLGVVGAKSPEQIRNPDRVALALIDSLLEENSDGIKERYGLIDEDLAGNDSYEILLKIGRKRGYLKKGGEVDETKTSLTIIREWQTGKIRK